MTSTPLDPIDLTEVRLATLVRAWTDQAVVPVDRAAVLRTATAPGSTRPMVSALRLAAAVALLALGSVALVLTAGRDSSPTPTTDLLDRLTTEEVEPGILRVVSDGTDHDFTVPDGYWNVQTGLDGSVWLMERSSPWWEGAEAATPILLRVGQAGGFDASQVYQHFRPDIAIGPDGVVWAVGAGGTKYTWTAGQPQLMALVDGTWVIHEPPAGYRVNGVEVATDGTVLVNGFATTSLGPRNHPGRPIVWRLGQDGWHELPPLSDEVTSAGFGGRLAIGPDGRPWLAVDASGSMMTPVFGGLFQFDIDGESWSTIPDVMSGQDVGVTSPAIGPDGTLWAYASRPESSFPRQRTLTRLSDGVWTTFDESDGVPFLGGYRGDYDAVMDVGQDGTLWFAFFEPEAAFGFHARVADAGSPGPIGDLGPGPCMGVWSFDGSTWRHYMGSMCANDLDVAADGRIWVAATMELSGFSGEPRAAAADGGIFIIDPAELREEETFHAIDDVAS